MDSLEIGYSHQATKGTRIRPTGAPVLVPSPPHHPDIKPIILDERDTVNWASRESSALSEISSDAEQRDSEQTVCAYPFLSEIGSGQAIESEGADFMNEIICEKPTVGFTSDASFGEGQETSGVLPKLGIKSRKRVREDIGEQSLLLIEPPRQSIRNRINIEYPKIKTLLPVVASPSIKKFKSGKKAKVKAEKRAGPKGKEGKTVDKHSDGRKGRKSKEAATPKRPIKSAQRALNTEKGPRLSTSISALEQDNLFGSMEAMDAVRPENRLSEGFGISLAERLKAKARKPISKLSDVEPAVEDSDIPMLELQSADRREVRQRGISSTLFIHVMRLVAGLPPMQTAAPRIRRQVPAHRPQVWAQSRQELCEALPYYRAFQSGLYLSQGIAFGYLLDGFPAPRDVCAHNGHVVISHGGGQCVRPTLIDGTTLPPVLAGDQSTADFRVATLIQAWQRRTPLVLLAGSGYKLLPFKLNCSYAVLGWYWVSLVWTEAEPVAQGIKHPNGREWYKRVKVRFDWVESQGKPWWELPAGTPPNAFAATSEVPLSPQAERVSVAALTQGVNEWRYRSSPARRKERRYRSLSSNTTLFSTDSEDEFLHSQLSSCITIDSRAYRRRAHDTTCRSPDPLPFYRTAVIGCEAASQDVRMSPRLPGDYCLASFEDSIAHENSEEPFFSLRRMCGHCRQSSPKIYAEGWICLNPTCIAYWMLSTDIGLLPIPPGMKLSYTACFLRPASTPVGARPPYSVVPPRPEGGIPAETGSATAVGSRGLWRGWVCDNCGRANCRFRWETWQCLGCNRLLAPIDPYSAAIPAQSLLSRNLATLGDPILDPLSGITVEMRRIANPSATVMVYTLPDHIGTIYHVVSDCAGFADEIFDRYQREAASTRVPLFQRRPLNAHQIKGELLAQHFAVNSGVSYKYNVDSCSLSFDDSPSGVIHALDAITIRTETVVGSRVDFNEVLSVFYREGQKMSWHDDGEPGLGPVVAGLSLGSDAVISWRKKSAHTASKASFNNGSQEPRKPPTPAIALSLTTSHGDIVMMQGREMQKKYVHRVIPSGFRVAATARMIGK